MSELSESIRYLNGIGEKRAKSLEKLGIFTVYDLLSYFPRAYEDRSIIYPVSELRDGESGCISAHVVSRPQYAHLRGKLDCVKFRVADGAEAVDITFFNAPYIKDQIKYGEEYVFYGKLSRNGAHASMTNPLFESADAPRAVTGRIVPVYALSAGLNQKSLQSAVTQLLNSVAGTLPETLPESIIRRFNLSGINHAYRNVHFPVSMESLGEARRRIVFEELFVLSAALGLMKRREIINAGHRIARHPPDEFLHALPFELTGAQKRALEQCMEDMSSGRAMNRLLQGDVGSGKTMVAAGLVWHAYKSELQSAFMAPTEILAEQHYYTLSPLLAKFGLRTLLLTGSMTPKAKREVREAIECGYAHLVVGTHAIISDGVTFDSLALVITDEQHRFGVRQRAALSGKGDRPHVLVMSATPIPRTLALIIYGDLDISVMDELPPGRQTIDTFMVGEDMRGRINNFIAKQVGEGRQVYIVCPAIDESETMDLKAAHEHAENIKRQFPDFSVSELHGKMRASEKDVIMKAFSAGETDILVSTTVIEVGVDVPNATLMVIENAERFGLSQLHQLRGRVGRGKHKSYCILFNQGTRESANRLKILTKTNDGFKISEEDLRQRGPGDFFGRRQHGLPELRLADLSCDMQILSEAQKAAEDLISDDPELRLPENKLIKDKVSAMFETNFN